MGDWLRSDEERWWDRLQLRTVVIALVAMLFIACFGTGYVLGRDPGTDLDDVGPSATAEGREAGLEQGTEQGYNAGLKAARQRDYTAAYAAAYREAYAGEFESQGLDPPERIPIPERR
jgi:hypothetical protein